MMGESKSHWLLPFDFPLLVLKVIYRCWKYFHFFPGVLTKWKAWFCLLSILSCSFFPRTAIKLFNQVDAQLVFFVISSSEIGARC